VALFCVPRAVAAEKAVLRAALDSVTASELQRHVDVLADDTFEGRQAGTRGGRAAAGYIVEQLRKFGLRGAGPDGGFVQSFGEGSGNILALLPGGDSKLRDEVILVGAHYDHVGYGSRRNSYGPTGYIHNGADDNASGVASVLELADALRQLPSAPKRSILLALWDAEEAGLLGSKHFVGEPTVPLNRIVLAVNMDMVGRLRDDRVELFGSRSAAGLRRIVSQSNGESNLSFDFTWEMKANSDHHTFFSRRIPTIMPHTGLHDDYHRPSDDAHKVNAEGIRRVTQWLLTMVLDAADRAELAGFREASLNESPASRERYERALPPPAPRLGVSWENAEGAQRGLVVVHAEPGSAAWRAGLRPGDRLVRFAGQDIVDESQFRADVLTAVNPVSISIERAGESAPRDVVVTLVGDPMRIGISWRENDAEPAAVTLVQVVPHSPAHRAGLAPRDRVYAVAGQPFDTGEEFHRFITTLPSPVELLIERNGQLKSVSMELPNPPEKLAAGD
jgi:hypothetical protein